MKKIEQIKQRLLDAADVEKHKAAYQLFVDTRNGDIRGRDGMHVKLMLYYRMELYEPYIRALRTAEIRRIQRRICHPVSRRRFLKMVDFLIDKSMVACSAGLITTNNNGNYAKQEAEGVSVTPASITNNSGDFDETKPYLNARKRMDLLKEYTIKYPLLWFVCFVLRL